MAGILDIPGYGGFLQKGQLNQQQAMGELQGVLGQIGAMQNIQNMQHQRAMQPLQQQMLQAQMTEMQRKAALEQQMAADRSALSPVDFMKKYKPEALAPIILKQAERAEAQGNIRGVLGQPGVAPIPEPPAEIGGGPGRPGMPATPGVLDQFKNSQNPQVRNYATAVEEMARRGVFADVKDFNAEIGKIGTLEAQIADRQEGRQMNDARAREMQQMSFDQQRSMRQLAAGIAASNRQPPAPHYITQQDGTVVAVSRDGAVQPVMGPDGKPVKGRVPASSPVELAISNRFESHPAVKRFTDLQPSVQQVVEYMQKRPSVNDAERSVNDKALVNTFLTMTHPKGDQISNFERKDLAGLSDVPEGIVNSIKGVFQGKRLTDDVAREMSNLVVQKFNLMGDTIKPIEENYLQQIVRNGGNPDSLRRITRPQQTPTVAPQQSTGQQGWGIRRLP